HIPSGVVRAISSLSVKRYAKGPLELPGAIGQPHRLFLLHFAATLLFTSGNKMSAISGAPQGVRLGYQPRLPYHPPLFTGGGQPKGGEGWRRSTNCEAGQIWRAGPWAVY